MKMVQEILWRALFNYYFTKKYDFRESIKKSMIAGALQVSGYTSNKKTYLKNIDTIV